MIVNVQDIAYYFNYCNREFFNCLLPVPGFKVLHSYKYCAYFTCDYDDWGEVISNPTIYISDYWKYSKKKVVNLMCHEMIHYYLALNCIDKEGTHGNEFKRLAKQLNKQHKLHITETVDTSRLKRNSDAPLLGYWLHKCFSWI